MRHYQEYQDIHHESSKRRGKLETEKIFEEIMAKTYQNLMENNLHIQEAQETPSKINLKRSSPRRFIIKTLKAKDKNFERSKRMDTLKHQENQHSSSRTP